jgi:hypothetical protein
LKVTYVPQRKLSDSALRGVDSLRQDREYVVLEVFSRPERSSLFRLEPIDAEPSALFDSRLFSVIDVRMPGTWCFFGLEGGSFCLCPEPWHERGFWEAFYDGEEWAIETYDREKARILQQS